MDFANESEVLTYVNQQLRPVEAARNGPFPCLFRPRAGFRGKPSNQIKPHQCEWKFYRSADVEQSPLFLELECWPLATRIEACEFTLALWIMRVTSDLMQLQFSTQTLTRTAGAWHSRAACCLKHGTSTATAPRFPRHCCTSSRTFLQTGLECPGTRWAITNPFTAFRNVRTKAHFRPRSSRIRILDRGVRETLTALECSETYDTLRRMAHANLDRWRCAAASIDEPSRTMVIADDWGEAALRLTQQYGQCFAVLNMANAYVPGGAYLEGVVAQEENMFRRTDCHLSVSADQLDASRDQYLPHMTRMLEAVDGTAYVDTQKPRFCFRGREDRSQHNLGYRWLADDEIFPYFELRAAACDLRDGRLFDTTECSPRVEALLDTLRRHGIRHVVLGAFGCGAFCNPAEHMAQIYRT